jgi:hypothetical protein
MAAPTVALVGLKAMQRDLYRLVDDRGPLNRAFQAAGRQAAEPTYAAAKSALPKSSGRLSGDLRIGATKSGATVRMGRASIRYAGWVEFGGHRKAPHPSSRDYDSRGRFLFPNALRLAPAAAAAYAAAVERQLNSFDWTNRGDQAGAVHD